MEAVVNKLGGIDGVNRLLRGEVTVGGSNIITVDRKKPFNPAEFIGKGWSFWRGPADGYGLQGELEQDERSLALTTLDTGKIILKTSLEGEKSWITGEENLKRLKSRRATFVSTSASFGRSGKIST